MARRPAVEPSDQAGAQVDTDDLVLDVLRPGQQTDRDVAFRPAVGKSLQNKGRDRLIRLEMAGNQPASQFGVTCQELQRLCELRLRGLWRQAGLADRKLSGLGQASLSEDRSLPLVVVERRPKPVRCHRPRCFDLATLIDAFDVKQPKLAGAGKRRERGARRDTLADPE